MLLRMCVYLVNKVPIQIILATVADDVVFDFGICIKEAGKQVNFVIPGSMIHDGTGDVGVGHCTIGVERSAAGDDGQVAQSLNGTPSLAGCTWWIEFAERQAKVNVLDVGDVVVRCCLV